MQFTFPVSLAVALALAGGLNTAFSAPTRLIPRQTGAYVASCEVQHFREGNSYTLSIKGVTPGTEAELCDGITKEAETLIPGMPKDYPPKCIPGNTTVRAVITPGKLSPKDQLPQISQVLTQQFVENQNGTCDIADIPA